MPQSIFVQVGQCGNQVGQRFWDLALQEYHHYQQLTYDATNFFKVESEGSSKVHNVKARAVMIDMEEGVISSLLRGHLKDLFDKQQLVTDVSGSGNNWAVGNKFYGVKYRERIVDLLRKEAECCDNLQCFFVLHSMGGGTGSGLGTAVVEYLHDEFSKTPRFAFATYPSSEDDVITSPYNTLLANSQLIKHADCVIPFENKALIDMCVKYPVSHSTPVRTVTKSKSQVKKSITPTKKQKAFDDMNTIIANVILNLTCSCRFPGSLNVDINEIVVNMTPYPKLHYLIPNLSPLSASGKCTIDQIFNDGFSVNNQLFQCPAPGIMLARTILCRGQVPLSDVQNNIDRHKRSVKFVSWNEDGWKIGLCDVPQIGYPCSVLVLSNTSAIAKPLAKFRNNFLKMFRKKAHLHHFLEVENMELDLMKSSVLELEEVVKQYRSLEQPPSSPELPRMKMFL